MKKDIEMQENDWLLNELKNIKQEILNIKLRIKEHDRKIEEIKPKRNVNIYEFDQIILNNLESRISILEEETEKYNRN